MRSFCASILLIWVAGCAVTPAARTASFPELRVAAAAAEAGKYGDAIEAYRKLAADPQTATAGEALFQAAYLLAYYENPKRDYALALNGFDEYIKRYPAGPLLREAKNWRSILKTILDLRTGIGRLNQQIDQLKQIDILHEEKRAQ